MEHSVLLIHLLAPLVAFSCFFLTSFIQTVISIRKATSSKDNEPNAEISTIESRRRNGPVLRSLASLVLLTYVTEAGILVSIKTSHQSTVPDDVLLSTFYRSLVWFILLLGLDASTSASQYPFFTACGVDWLFNAIIFGADIVDLGQPQGIQIFQLIVQGLRLSLEAAILLFPLLRKLICRHSMAKTTDEEAAPLIGAETTSSDQSNQVTSYGSVNTSPDPGTSQNTSNPEPEQNESPGDDDDDEHAPKKMTKHWWIYVQSFFIFLPYLWPSDSIMLRSCYIGTGLCIMVTRFLKVIIPLQLGMIVNALTDDQSGIPWQHILTYILFQLLVSSGGIDMVQEILWLTVEKYSLSKLSCASYDHVMGLSYDFHSNKKSGAMWQVMHRGQAVVELLRNVSFDLGPTFIDLVIAVAVFYWLFDAYMAFIGAVAVVLVVFTTHKSLTKKKEGWRRYLKLLDTTYEQMTESTLNWTTVSYFNRIKYEEERFRKYVAAEKTGYISYRMLSSALTSLRSLILLIGLFMAMLLAATQIKSGERQVGDFVALLTYWTQLSVPLAYFAVGFSHIVENLIDCEKLLELLRQKSTVQDKPDAEKFQLRHGKIHFKDVKFSYDGKRDVLQGISFGVLPGQTVALVGETGGGKSTILRLLYRFYDVTDGSIKIDGQDLRDVTQESLRHHFGVVPQDAVLFNSTILENLRYARLDATEEECIEACKAVALHDKIMSFSKGYHTICGERGVKMSGGEIQRMAIARVFIKEPSIILLDEATSSVDSETEAIIQSSLATLTRGKTTFVIAHRLSTIVNADLVLVIRSGQIAERGTHDELIRAKGYYSDLWSHQVKLSIGSGNSKSADSAQAGPPVFVNDLQLVTKNNDASDSKNQKKTGKPGVPQRIASIVSKRHSYDHNAHSAAHGTRERSQSPAKASRPGSSGSKTALKPDAPEFIPQRTKNDTRDARPRLSSQNKTLAEDTPIDSISKSTPILPTSTAANKEPRRRFKKRKSSLSNVNKQVKQSASDIEEDNSNINTGQPRPIPPTPESMTDLAFLRSDTAAKSKDTPAEPGISPKRRLSIFSRRKDSKSEPSSNKPGSTTQMDGMTSSSSSDDELDDASGEDTTAVNGVAKPTDPVPSTNAEGSKSRGASRQRKHRRGTKSAANVVGGSEASANTPPTGVIPPASTPIMSIRGPGGEEYVVAGSLASEN